MLSVKFAKSCLKCFIAFSVPWIGIFGNFNFLLFVVDLSLSLDLRHRLHFCDYTVIFRIKTPDSSLLGRMIPSVFDLSCEIP